MEAKYNAALCEEHRKQLERIELRLTAVEKWKGGNGTKGVETRLSMMEADIPEMASDLKQIKRLLWIGIGILLVLQPILAVVMNHIIKEKL